MRFIWHKLLCELFQMHSFSQGEERVSDFTTEGFQSVLNINKTFLSVRENMLRGNKHRNILTKKKEGATAGKQGCRSACNML